MESRMGVLRHRPTRQSLVPSTSNRLRRWSLRTPTRPELHCRAGSHDALRYGRDRLARRRNRRRSRRACHGRQRRWWRQRRRVLHRGRRRQFGWRGRGRQLGRWRRRRQRRRRQRRRRQRRGRWERRRGRQRWRGRQGDPRGRELGCCAARVRGGSGRAHEAHADECERCRQAPTPRLGQSAHQVLNAYAPKVVTGLASPNGGAALTRASRRITL